MDKINYAPPTSVVIGSIRSLTQATNYTGSRHDANYPSVTDLDGNHEITGQGDVLYATWS